MITDYQWKFCLLLLLIYGCITHGYLVPLARRGRQLSIHGVKNSLIVGINKYSHDASCCIVDGNNGEILFAQAKERVSSIKHDSGDIASLLKLALKSVGGELQDVHTVVQNNHHFRIHPFEKRLPFATSIHYHPKSYLDEYNLLSNAKHYEISHHLAHAWSGLATAPFADGLIVVMDGMGESYKAMIEDMKGLEHYSGDYLHDLKLLRHFGSNEFIGQPYSLSPGSTYREAESAYLFDCQQAKLQPIFKRWSRERSPPELYNHGFENMESIGAIYSRLSSHILGDWNACGKVMGLASWANRRPQDAQNWYYPNNPNHNEDQLRIGQDFHHRYQFMKGNPVLGTFEVDWQLLDEQLAGANQFSNRHFDYYANLAASIQENLNTVTLEMLQSLQQRSQAKQLVLVGGVALNSILTMRIVESKLFERVYVPAAPGDEGIAIGCALYGYQRKLLAEAEANKEKVSKTRKSNDQSTQSAMTEEKDEKNSNACCGGGCSQPDESTSSASRDFTANCDLPEPPPIIPFHQQSLSPYSGLEITDEMIELALEEYQSYLTIESLASEEALIEDASQALVDGKVIAWFQGKSEFGQRALGHRSILGNPTIASLRRFINQEIKFREWYRPLAPSVLADQVQDWFELPALWQSSERNHFSPFMSYTAPIKSEKVAEVPAVAHIDHTARLQTVISTDPETKLYYQLLQRFFQKTRIPMILNTSLNKQSQPILETPLQAIQLLLSLQGKIDTLYLERYKIRIKPFPLDEKIDKASTTNEEGNKEEGLSEELLLLTIKAKKLYLSEVTMNHQTDQPSSSPSTRKVRIQDSLHLLDPFEAYDLPLDPYDVSSGGSAETQKWRELPSDLHLEILQLLQENDESEDSSGDSEMMITVGELWEALLQLRGSSEEEEEGEIASKLSWQEVLTALRWLYYEGLVEFGTIDTNGDDLNADNHSSGNEEEEQIITEDLSSLFPGVAIRDYRDKSVKSVNK